MKVPLPIVEFLTEIMSISGVVTIPENLEKLDHRYDLV